MEDELPEALLPIRRNVYPSTIEEIKKYQSWAESGEVRNNWCVERFEFRTTSSGTYAFAILRYVHLQISRKPNDELTAF